MNLRTGNSLGICLTLLGLLQVSGFLAAFAGLPHAESLIRLGQGIAVSPLPTPFRDSNGYENFASYRTYEITLRDGTTHRLTDQDLGHILPGPHRRVVPYFNSLVMLPRLPQELTTPILRYLFCESDLAERDHLATAENPIAHVEIRVAVRTDNREDFSWKTGIRCEL